MGRNYLARQSGDATNAVLGGRRHVDLRGVRRLVVVRLFGLRLQGRGERFAARKKAS